jgi:hypothetical protein
VQKRICPAWLTNETWNRGKIFIFEDHMKILNNIMKKA